MKLSGLSGRSSASFPKFDLHDCLDARALPRVQPQHAAWFPQASPTLVHLVRPHVCLCDDPPTLLFAACPALPGFPRASSYINVKSTSITTHALPAIQPQTSSLLNLAPSPRFCTSKQHVPWFFALYNSRLSARVHTLHGSVNSSQLQSVLPGNASTTSRIQHSTKMDFSTSRRCTNIAL